MALHSVLLERIDRQRAWIRAHIVELWDRRRHVGGISRRHDRLEDSWMAQRLRELSGFQANDNADPIVDLVATRIDRTNAADMARLISISMRADPHIGPQLDAFREAALGRITSLDADTIDDLRDVLDEAELGGWRVEDLADAIEERLGVAESKAALYARNSVMQANAQITRARQTASGIEKFEWSTSGDERVRESHDELDGEVFSWDDLPSVDDDDDVMPGMLPNCRCVSIPVLPEDAEDEDDADEEDAVEDDDYAIAAE